MVAVFSETGVSEEEEPKEPVVETVERPILIY